MRCTNCDTRIPHGLTSCPNCGVYARDEPPRPPAPPRRVWWPLVVLLVIVIAAAAFWLTRKKPAPIAKPDPVHVVRGRPGGNTAEAEAIRALRHHLTARNVPSECVAVMSYGLQAGSYRLKAYDRCKNLDLGEWRVDAKTHEVTMK